MTAFRYALTETRTMLRRNLRRMRRYPTVQYQAGIPAFFLVLFVYVLGGTLGAGLAVSGTRADYVAYLTPGILIMTVAGGATGTAVAVAMDMTEGIIARFRTMAISRGSVLAGHVLGSVIQTILALAIVVVVALLIGFRPTSNPLAWLGALALLALIAVAIAWLGAALGLAAGSVESASNLPFPLLLLPFFGSGFVPTDSMPDPLRLFAENQPFTPMIDTVRGLLLGTPIGTNAIAAVAWSLAIAAASYVWALKLYAREPAH